MKAIIDIAKLLVAVSRDAPCGENLEYDPAFGELERAVQGKPERTMGDAIIPAEPANWHEVQAQALQLLIRTKDLRVAVHLTCALLWTEGVRGLCAGLALVRGLIEQYWNCLYPQLEADDDYDPSFRINTLMALADASTVLVALRGTPLLRASVLGQYSWRDIAFALSERGSSADVSEGQADKPTIDAAFLGCDISELQETLAAVSGSLDHAQAIEAMVAHHTSSAAIALNFDPLRGLLRSMQKFLSDKLLVRQPQSDIAPKQETPRLGGEEARASHQPPSSLPPNSIPEAISSRDEVIRVLELVCDYYRRYEPSSPVPILVQRAKGLVSKNFMEILQELSPDSLAQVEMIRGRGREGS